MKATTLTGKYAHDRNIGFFKLASTDKTPSLKFIDNTRYQQQTTISTPSCALSQLPLSAERQVTVYKRNQPTRTKNAAFRRQSTENLQ